MNRPNLIISVLFLSLSYLIIFLGMTSNFIAIKENGGLMPVLSDYQIKGNEHFSFQDSNEVNKYFFVDRFHINYTVFSIGDFVLIFGLTLMITFTLFISLDIRDYRKGRLIIKKIKRGNGIKIYN